MRSPSHIHVFNLRGNQRTAGEQSRREGGKVFDAGSRATVAITVLVKNPEHHGPATLHYRDVGDYLTREDKLRIVAETRSIEHLDGASITPNAHGDWLGQRRDDFLTFLPTGDKPRKGEVRADVLFPAYSRGLESGRDAWVYNSSADHLQQNMIATIATYNGEIARWNSSGLTGNDAVTNFAIQDPRLLSWSRSLRGHLRQGRHGQFSADKVVDSVYRPFTKQHLYFDVTFNHERSQLPKLFPSSQHPNYGFYYVGAGSAVPFSVLMLDSIPDLHVTGAGSGGQFFPRWSYAPLQDEGTLLPSSSEGEVVDGYRRIDNITDEAVAKFRAAYGPEFSKDDVFTYVYGLLHSRDYRTTYAVDLKKSLPRIPLVTDATPYVKAGRALSELHLGYEHIDPYPLDGLDGGPTDAGTAAFEHYRVTKMQFGKPTPEQKSAGLRHDRSTVVYNARLTLRGIPYAAYEYLLGSRSAVEWIMDRYQVKTDKASGIVNDPNDWSREVNDPRYILDLLARIVTVSLRTQEIVDSLPGLSVRTET